MKVLDLQCSHGHAFEGWFASEDDFQSQCARSMVQCPLCGNAEIVKKLSAPRLSLSAHPTAQSEPSPPSKDLAVNADQQVAAAWIAMARHVMANTTDVGTRFAEEARKMHYGESQSRNIRGQATPQETQALADEGIDVVSLPIPDFAKEPLQ